MQVTVGNVLRISRVVAFPDNRRMVSTCFKVTVEAVRGCVQCAIVKPFNRYARCFEVYVPDLCIWLDPVDTLAVLSPKGLRIIDRSAIHIFILGFINMRVFGEFGRDRIYVCFTHLNVSLMPAVFQRSCGFPTLKTIIDNMRTLPSGYQ